MERPAAWTDGGRWASIRRVIGNLNRRPDPAWMAWILLGLQAVLCPLTYGLGLETRGNLPPILQFGEWETFAPLLALEFGLVGALIVGRHPRHSVGWLAIIGGLCTSLSVFAGVYAAYAATRGQLLPATWLALWLRGWLWYPGLAFLFVLLPAVFPDGALLSRRWRPIVWAIAAGCGIQLVHVSLTQAMFGFPLSDGPYPRLGWLLNPLSPLAGMLLLAPLFAVVVAVLVRFRRSSSAARRQLKWFLAAVALQAVGWAVSQAANVVPQLAPLSVLVPTVLLLVPVAIGIAILRHRLYDIDIVISRGLAYAGLAAFITLAYLLVVVGIGLALRTGGRPNLPLSVVAMALVTLLIQPVRMWLQRLANRMVYGAPADPYAVLAQLSKTPAAGDVDHALAQIAQAMARGMGSRQARVRLHLPGGQARTATWPVAAGGPFGPSVAVRLGAETVGELEAEGSSDRGLMEALTAQAGLALRALRLSAELDARLVELEVQAEELGASRTRLVHAEEAERRRWERDLHDGIQQDLVVLVAKAGLARNQLERDPAAAASTLAELQTSAQHAIADLRSLAHGIHPAVLSSRGLIEAIDSMAARMPMGVRIDSGLTGREVRYSPEIEGAAYFVVAEGLANVLKHSGATEASVTVSSSGSCLRLAIADDGRGFDPKTVRESGLRGLRDRVEALGGHVAVDSGQSGTRLDVSLPTAIGPQARSG
jgi:signal transduction histidine kinase